MATSAVYAVRCRMRTLVGGGLLQGVGGMGLSLRAEDPAGGWGMGLLAVSLCYHTIPTILLKSSTHMYLYHVHGMIQAGGYG